jgi:hypothetical protein
LAGLSVFEQEAIDVVMLGLAYAHSKSATKKPPEGGYLVQWSQRPGSNR